MITQLMVSFSTKVIGKRKPDITAYLTNITESELTIAFCLEIKQPHSAHSEEDVYPTEQFPVGEVAQTIDYAIRILRKNRLRQFVYVVLTDTQIIQLYKVDRAILDCNYQVKASAVETFKVRSMNN